MTITWRSMAVAVVAAAGLLLSGCLLKEEAHTWYLDPSIGTVTWTVLQQDVRSDARAAADRYREEMSFWTEVRAENHPIARAFRQLGAATIRTRILRAEVPYSVVTDATFDSLERLGQQLIVAAGLSGTSTLTTDGDAFEWLMTIRDPNAEEPPSSQELQDLLSAFDTLRVVLVSGRFESATGFVLDSDRRVARIDADALDSDTGTVVWRLRLVRGSEAFSTDLVATVPEVALRFPESF